MIAFKDKCHKCANAPTCYFTQDIMQKRTCEEGDGVSFVDNTPEQQDELNKKYFSSLIATRTIATGAVDIINLAHQKLNILMENQ